MRESALWGKIEKTETLQFELKIKNNNRGKKIKLIQ